MSNFFDFSDEHLEDAEELGAAPAGEYSVAIKDWKTDSKGKVIQKDKNDFPYIMPKLEIVDHPDAENFKDFTMFIRMPHDDQSAKEKKQTRWELKCFCEAFGIPMTGRVDWDEQIGNMAEDVILSLEEGGPYGDQNKVSKFTRAA